MKKKYFSKQKFAICWIRHGERQDRTESSGITADSYNRLAEIGQQLKKGFASVEIIHSPQKRAEESAAALAAGIAKAGNGGAVMTDSSEVDELHIDERYQKNADGQRVSGGELFEQLKKGVRLSTKESNESYAARLVDFHNKLLARAKENTLIIIVHHDFGLDLVLKELLKLHQLPYDSNGKTRFQREEYVEYVYEKNAVWHLKNILLPTREKKYEINSQNIHDLGFLKDFKWILMYRENANILAMFMALDCRTARMDLTVGTNFKAFAGKIENNFFTLYMNHEDSHRVSKFILHRILSEPDWVGHISQQVYQKAQELLTFSRSLKSKNYDACSNLQLLELYKEFCKRFMAMRVYSSIPTNLEHGTNVFTEHLQERLRAYVKNSEDANEVFSILTTPNKDSYIREEEISLLNVGAARETQEFEKMLKNHVIRYTWKKYSFEGVPLTKEDFRQELNALREKGTNFDVELRKAEAYHPLLLKKQAAIISKYKIDEELQRLFSYGKEFVFIKFFRKGTFAESYYSVEFLLNAIAERLGTDLRTIRGMLYDEVRESLLENKFNKETIESRMRNGFIISVNGETFDLPEEYQELILKNIQSPDINERNEWKGQTACPGSAIGRVKIVNTVKDMAKMNEKDILVSRSTNPDLVPSMRKAAAIVTELGGLTCHAAIVSREWGTPCVVGIDHITEMLRDGDRVEVHATKGIVRRIE